MPPVMFAALEWPFTRLAHSLLPAAMANGIIAGAFAFCERSRHSHVTRSLTLT